MKNKGIKFIYWFAYYHLDSPSVRYRAKYPLDYFKKNYDIHSYLVIPSYSIKGICLFLRAYFSALLFRKRNSVIVIQRVRSNFIYSTFLKILVKLRRHHTAYDLDDADYLEHNPESIYYFASNCESVFAGSQNIAKYLLRFNPNIIHLTSPVCDLNIIKGKRNELFTIGWIGGYRWGHRESLIELIFPALMQTDFNVKFVLIGVKSDEDTNFIKDYFFEKDNILIEIPNVIDWNNEAEIQGRIASFDIGIATLLDNPIQTSKSGIKVKQYLNNGIPVLSSNLPENSSVVIHGVNGYLCSSAKEFKERIHEFYLMSDPDYLMFSTNARNSIINFDHNNYFKDFAKVMEVGVK